MFAKFSLMSFIYEMLETLCFPDKKVQEVYDKYLIEKVHIYHVLTDTDSTCLQFLFISDPKSNICEQKYSEMISEVIIASKIYNRFDSSHEYWEQFNSRKENLHKCLGYFEIENIDNPCILTIACNPNEYFELFENNKVNKKHKGIRKGSSGLNYESCVSRLVSLTNFDTFGKPSSEYKEVSRLTVHQIEMQKKTSLKTKFPQFNDKRFYFSHGTTSLLLSHPYLKELVEYKKKMGQRTERYFWHEKETLLNIENKTQQQNKRLFLYHQILMNAADYFLLDQKENFIAKTPLIFKETRDIILEGS